jgi:hypothetical protein
MDGRAGVQPTERNGSVVRDEPSGTSTSATTEEIVRFPLTIREVVRRGRRDREELERLRSEVDQLRLRAESAEQLLEAGPRAPEPVSPARNGHDTVNGNGHGASNGNGNGNAAEHGWARRTPAAPRGWAPAAMLPRSRPR